MVTLLEQSAEGKGKTLFGGYSSTVVRDWKSLEKLYRARNLHIVDLAKCAVQNVQYDMYVHTLHLSALASRRTSCCWTSRSTPTTRS